MKKKMVALILTALLLGGCAGNLSHSTDLTATVSGAVIEKVDISGESYQPQNPKQKIACGTSSCCGRFLRKTSCSPHCR